MSRRRPDTYPLWIALVGLAVMAFAVLQLRRGCGPDPADVEREARRPAPGHSREDRLPRWDDDDEVLVAEPGRPEVRVRWGDIRAEAEPRMLPRANR